MKIYEKKAKECEYLLKVICDICSKESNSDSWLEDSFERDDTKLSLKTVINNTKGRYSLDGGYGTKIEVDICPDCFRNKLVPWLKTQGVKINKIEWDY